MVLAVWVDSGTAVRVDGRPVTTTAVLSPDRLEGGVLLALADRILLLLHRQRPSLAEGEDEGLLGRSEGMVRIRREIRRVAPLDVTNYIALDASNTAHLAASGYRTGELAARVLEPLLEQEAEPSYGRIHIAGAVAVASVIWPDLFLKTRMRLEIDVEGPRAGQCKPGLGGDKSRYVDLLTAVNAVDLLENMLESLCHEEFVV